MSDPNRSVNGISPGPEENLKMFAGHRGWQVGLLGSGLVLALFLFWVNQVWYQIDRDGAVAFHLDFKVFWATARLALAGDPLAAFDVNQLGAVHQVVEENDWMPWSYPPSFMVALAPFGAFSFPIAWGLFSVISIIAMVLATRLFCAGVTPVWLAFSLPPALIPNLFVGQTTALWIAALLAAMAALRNGRFVLAGVFIGLLTLKPQLGILIPFALIACGAWRTFTSAAVTTVVISALATLIVGADYWVEMRNMMDTHFEYVRSVVAENYIMVGTYSMLAGLGINPDLALTLQWLTTAVMAVVVFIAWRSPKIGFDLRVAVLILGIMLATPYLWFYESGLLAPAALFMLRAGILIRSPWGLCLAAAMWIGVAPAFFPQILENGFEVSLRLAFAPIIILACATCLHSVFAHLRKPLELPAKDEVLP